ncbi:MAG: ATP-binding protein [Candidatus Acidiferrales bacterium]
MAKREPASRPTPPEDSGVEARHTIPARADEIEKVLGELLGAIEKTKLRCGDIDEIRLALREALNNALKHGSRLDTSKKIHFAYRCDPEQGLWVMVRDEGSGFDPEVVTDPTTPENLDRTGGRGVFLIRNLMDKVEFREGGREVQMWRHLRPDS